MGAPLKWFPLFIDDLETDAEWRSMTWEERGVYIVLLCWQWREGAVPGDARRAARMIHASVPVVRGVLARCFVEEGGEDRMVVNRKLAEIRVKQLDKASKASNAARSWRTSDQRFLYAATMTPISFSDEKGEPQIKIGWSRNPKTRIAALARELRQRILLIGSRPAGITLEAKAHTDLAAYKIGGEWFRDVPAVRQWLVTNGVTGAPSGNTGGNSSG